MPKSLRELERERDDLLGGLGQLGDFRAGSITSAHRRCGKPACCCAKPDHPGHGPLLRLTYKLGPRSLTESLPTKSAVEKARREIAEFRKYQQLSRELIRVSGEICKLRGEAGEQEEAREKKRKRQYTRKSSRK